MIVEFIGSTGAGKSTLFAAVQHKLAHVEEVVTSFDLIAEQLRLQSLLRGVTHPSVKNLIQEFVGFPFFLGSLPHHWALVSFVLRMLRRHGRVTFVTINNVRSLVRKIATEQIVRGNKQNHIVLVDEGLVLLAHNIFVYTHAHYTPEETARFATLIPLPDAIVYVRAPVNGLVERALTRPDGRRELRAKNRLQVETYIRRAVAMFEQLILTEEIRSRVLIVENPEMADERRDQVVECIARFVLNQRASASKIDAPIEDYDSGYHDGYHSGYRGRTTC
jgi:adenylate kinase